MNRYIYAVVLLICNLNLTAQGPSFIFSSHRLCQKQLIIKVSVLDFSDMHAFRFPIRWNPQVLKFIKVDSCNLPEFSPVDFDISLQEEGICYVNWELKKNPPGQQYKACTVNDNKTIFELHFTPLRDDGDSNAGIHFEWPGKTIDARRSSGNEYVSVGLRQKEAHLRGCYEKDGKNLRVDLKYPSQDWPAKTTTVKRNNYALLFAINNYTNVPDLQNPVKDAHQIANELETSYGFNTQVVENVDYDSIDVTLNLYAQKFKELADTTSQLFIFFSGHGQLDELKKGYFLARNTDPKYLYRTGLGYEYLDDKINEIPCRHILVCVDACYSGSFDPLLGNRGVDYSRPNELSNQAKFLRDHNLTKTRLFFTSALNTSPSPDKSNFAAKLLEGLKGGARSSGFLTVSKLYSSLETVFPKPHFGSFGDNQPGSTFIFYPNSYLHRATFESIKDNAGNTYRTVRIGNLEWLAEDMTYDVNHQSWLLPDSLSKKHNFYGRFYSYQGAAIACMSLGNGWRLPTFEEWKGLIESYGGYRFTDVETIENGNRLYYYPSKSNDLISAALALTNGGESGLNLSTSVGMIFDNSFIKTFEPFIQKSVAYWSSTSANGKKLDPFDFTQKNQDTGIRDFDSSYPMSISLSKKAVYVGYANPQKKGLQCRCVR